MSDRPASRRAIDLSHEIVDGMVTHPGIPAPVISTFLTHEASAARYAPGDHVRDRADRSRRADRDLPRHACAPFLGWADLSDLDPRDGSSTSTPSSSTVRGRRTSGAIEPDAFAGIEVAGRAVLVATGWDRHWGTQMRTWATTRS